jgi:chromosome segregation ATPase
MTITYELDLNRFEAWSGAKETLERIQREGKCEELENVLEELYPDGMTETELNDLLWFDSESVYEWLGIRSEEQIEKEIKEAEEELAEVQSNLEDDFDDDELTTEERAEIIESYQPDIDEIKERIADLKEELSEL